MTKPKRRALAGAISQPELRDRLDRVRAALDAAKRAPQGKAARQLETDLYRQIRCLERDISNAPSA